MVCQEDKEVSSNRGLEWFAKKIRKRKIAVLKSGRNPTMRHLGRTHRVSEAWLHEVFLSGKMILNKCDTSDQAADIFTRSFTDEAKKKHACSLIHFGASIKYHVLPFPVTERSDRLWPRAAAAVERQAFPV
eukprot:5048029-Amphidinium_carterae.1